jgi:hypothetical protein
MTRARGVARGWWRGGTGSRSTREAKNMRDRQKSGKPYGQNHWLQPPDDGQQEGRRGGSENRLSRQFQGCFKIQIRPPIIPVSIPVVLVDPDADSFHLSLLSNLKTSGPVYRTSKTPFFSADPPRCSYPDYYIYWRRRPTPVILLPSQPQFLINSASSFSELSSQVLQR